MDGPAPRRRKPRDLIFQVLGFLAGLGLLWWCVERAFADDGATETWTAIRAAPSWALWGLAVTSVGSLLVNSLMFWFAIQPVRPVGVGEMTGVNLVASLLNYLPIPLRVGLIARIAYHVRVNRMGAVALGSYLGALMIATLVVFAGLAAAVVTFAFVGAAAAAGAALVSLVVGMTLVRRIARWKLVARYGREAERILVDRKALGGAVAMRTADALLWSARMTCAVAVLGLPLSAGESAVLGLVAVAMSMNPLGRFGFREAGVVWVSTFLFAGRMEADELEQAFARLAIVESAAEGAVTLPLGAVLVPWFLGRMRNAPAGDASPRPADGAAQAVVDREVPKA
jgi:hypothetical protein